jgi:hypothetical protein
LAGETVAFFISFFQNFSWVGFGLAVVFGIVWLAGFLPPLLRRPWLWAVLVASAFLTLAAIAFVQVPLQFAAGNALSRFFGMETVLRLMLLTAIPGILLSGFIQEGAKMIPMLFFWRGQKRKINPGLGLCLGAVAGAGYGIFEANWIHGLVLTSGWSWSVVGTAGFMGLTPFTERFFVVAFHTGASALVGYGLAKGRGGQFYLIAALLHAALNYIAILMQARVLPVVWLEVIIAVWSLAVVGFALWLRWRKAPPEALPVAVEPVSPAPAEPVASGTAST